MPQELTDQELFQIRERDSLDFGDYCIIEQHRYGCDNEHYIYKVIGRLRSNTWVDVPVMHNATETMHDHMEDVIRCICCGVSETEVLKYKLSDVRPQKRTKVKELVSALEEISQSYSLTASMEIAQIALYNYQNKQQ